MTRQPEVEPEELELELELDDDDEPELEVDALVAVVMPELELDDWVVVPELEVDALVAGVVPELEVVESELEVPVEAVLTAVDARPEPSWPRCPSWKQRSWSRPPSSFPCGRRPRTWSGSSRRTLQLLTTCWRTGRRSSRRCTRRGRRRRAAGDEGGRVHGGVLGESGVT